MSLGLQALLAPDMKHVSSFAEYDDRDAMQRSLRRRESSPFDPAPKIKEAVWVEPDCVERSMRMSTPALPPSDPSGRCPAPSATTLAPALAASACPAAMG